MSKSMITKEELIKAREDLINMAIEHEPNQRKIFVGDNKFLLTGRKLTISKERIETDQRKLKECKNEMFYEILQHGMNNSCDDYLGALLYVLHQKTGCHFIYGYRQLDDNHHRWVRTDRLEFDYEDKDIVDHIKNHHIQTFARIGLKDGQDSKSINQSLETCEFNSSYSYAGMTGFSDSLCEIAETNGFNAQRVFTGRPDNEVFQNTKSRFSDERIAAYARIGWNIGVLVNRGLTIEEIWPYTMDAVFKVNTNPDFDQIIKIFNILYEHILYIQKSIEEKGMELAFKLSSR